MTRRRESPPANEKSNESGLNFLAAILNLWIATMRLIGLAAKDIDANDPKGAKDKLDKAHETAANGWRRTRDEIERQDRRRR